MRKSQLCMFLGIMILGLLHGPAPLRAQPASELVSTGGNSEPLEPAPPAEADDNSTRAAAESDLPKDEPMVSDETDKPWSQGVTAEERRAARQLFREGNRMFRLPLYAKAVELYTAALSKWKHPAFYFNLAIAQLNLGKEIEARENLQHALKYGEQGLAEEEFREAHKQLKELERQLGRIRVRCRTQGAEVSLDGVTLFIGPGSYEGWTKAKSHELTAKKSGYLSEARRVMVTPDNPQDIELKLVTLSEAADTGRRWAVWKPWTVVVVGGAVAIAGGLLHSRAFNEFKAYDNDVRDLCTTKPESGCQSSDPALKELVPELALAQREQAIAVGGYIVGGSLIAAGVVLLYLNRPRLVEQNASGLLGNQIAIIPTMSSDMIGAIMSGNY